LKPLTEREVDDAKDILWVHSDANLPKSLRGGIKQINNIEAVAWIP